MSVQPFLVPDLGEGLEDITLLGWNVGVGDEVELNQTLCSVETAKAEVDIPSPYAGRIVELGGRAGDVLTVGSVLARIETTPETVPARAVAVMTGYGIDDAVDTSRRIPSRSPDKGRPKAKPSVRKLAAELGVDLGQVLPGSDGLITRAAVLAAAETADVHSGVRDEVLPVRGIAARMAERMALARREIPDAHARVQVDCTNLLRVHERLKSATAADAEGEAPITPFVLTLRMLVICLTRHRVLNSTWVNSSAGPQVHAHHAVHLGLAVATSRGLLVPVIADAQTMTTRELAAAVAQLTRTTRAGTVKPAELQGSTFTVSNFGALGLDDGVPVINYPEAAILGMGSLKSRPAVVDDVVTARPQMALTCAFDHRIADGAHVAHFLCGLRDLLESPEIALLDL